MTTNINDIETLELVWTTFKNVHNTGTSISPSEAIISACASVGYSVARRDVDDLMRLFRISKFASEGQFFAVLALLAGDRSLRISTAYRLLAQDGAGVVPIDLFAKVLGLFGLSDGEAQALAVEVSADGSDTLSLQVLLQFLPQNFDAHPKAFHGGVAAHQHKVPRRAASQKRVDLPSADLDFKAHDIGGTSPLQMQIGLFRLLQGAAYRCFRASYSANSESHLRAYDLPYTIFDFANFANKAIDLYLDLGIVAADALQPLEDLRQSINDAIIALKLRMRDWNADTATAAMREAEALLEAEISDHDHKRQIVAAALELVLTGAALGHQPHEITQEDVQVHELNRLRALDDHREVSGHNYARPHTELETRRPFIETWQRVIIDDVDTHYAGAIMPTRYWYEDFMPKLLRACSVLVEEDLAEESHTDLDSWFATKRDAGEFSPYATDVLERFESCTLEVKRAVKRAWRLTRHYLNGVQKRREREEFGRESGYLSEYVTFLDVYLGRNDVEQSEMRISFPYFIGPATWRFLHTSAEIIVQLPAQRQIGAVENFKAFFGAMATIYPCPYCRFHLNRYVVKNRELHLYPIEYLLLGPQSSTSQIEVTLQQKMGVIDSAESLRLFLWKLHNTVSSSIARTEKWYHRDEGALYTSRYWPSLDSELARAQAMGLTVLETDRVRRIYGVLKQAAHLSVVRDELQQALAQVQTDTISDVMSRATKIIALAEDAILASRFLHDTYHFNPEGDLTSPHFSAEEEALARSGYYVEA
jgi:hypothetical protein